MHIKKLIVKNWFISFLGAFFLLFALLTIANFISGFLRPNVTATEVIFNHFLEIPSHLKLLTPVSCLAASLFSINKLKNSNELTAIFASGYSRKEYILDIASSSFLVALFLFLIGSFVQPYAKSKKELLITNSSSKFRNLKPKGLVSSAITSGKMWFKSNGSILNFSSYEKETLSLRNISLYIFNNNKIEHIYHAPEARFVGEAWIGENVSYISELNLKKFPEKGSFNSLNLPIKQTPSDLKQIESDITTLSIFSLYRYIYHLYINGINTDEYLVLFLETFSSSIICIIFAVFAATGVFKPNRRNNTFSKNVLFTLVFVIIYWLINSYLVELGKSSKLNPIAATFLVPLLFIIYISYYFTKHKRLK